MEIKIQSPDPLNIPGEGLTQGRECNAGLYKMRKLLGRYLMQKVGIIRGILQR